MSPLWILLTLGADAGEAAALATMVSEGVHGETVRRVEVKGASADLVRSAAHACGQAATILYRERYLDREILVRFAVEDAASVHGRSAELAFALALVGAIVKFPLPPLAATGLIEEGGAIRAVEGVGAKLAAALRALPRGATFVYPAANENAVTQDLRGQAALAGVSLQPAHRLEDLLAQLGVRIASTWLAEPFRGLEPFGPEHSSIFFGRSTEIEALATLLDRRSAVLLRGPSGAGKSSLALAGLIPALMRRTGGASLRWGLLRPRDIVSHASPELERRALAQALANAWTAPGASMSVTIEPTLDGGDLVRRIAATGAVPPLLVLDQFEELFASPLQPSTVEALASLLADLNAGGVRLLVILANAALMAFAALQPLSARFGIEGEFVLEPRHDAAFLQAVVEGPAKAAALSFETGLDAELVAAASNGGPDVLPLLELLLTELFERRERGTGALRWDDYRAVGGLDGVVSARAEAAYADLSAAQRAAAPIMIWKLATAGAIDTIAFGADHHIHAVLAALQARRLIVRDAVDGRERLRPAHEALLRHWSRARDQIRQDADDIALWRDLDREGRQWRTGRRALIAAGPQLDAAESLCARRRTTLAPTDADLLAYVETSLRQHRRRRLLAGLALAVPALGFGGSGVAYAWRKWRAIYRSDIDFADIPVRGPDYVVAAEPYLHKLGITVPERVPADSRIVVRSNLGLYGGRAAEAGASQNFLTQELDSPIAPVSYTLAFARPPRRIGIFRATLWAATASGVTHPAWTATAFDGTGERIASVRERLLAEFTTIPGNWFDLDSGDAGRPIASVKIESDYRSHGRPFAGVHAVLINELVLYY